MNGIDKTKVVVAIAELLPNGVSADPVFERGYTQALKDAIQKIKKMPTDE